jgi:soluble lytic murein transglycosylase-like protein
MTRVVLIALGLLCASRLHAPEYNQYAHVDEGIIYPDLILSDVDLYIKAKIVNMSILNSVPSTFALNIAYTESRFKPNVVSINKDGSHNYGIFQLSDYVVKLYELRNPLNIDINIEVALDILANYWRYYEGDEKKIVCVWTRGPANCK